jgi:hypothetical protein
VCEVVINEFDFTRRRLLTHSTKSPHLLKKELFSYTSHTVGESDKPSLIDIASAIANDAICANKLDAVTNPHRESTRLHQYNLHCEFQIFKKKILY